MRRQATRLRSAKAVLKSFVRFNEYCASFRNSPQDGEKNQCIFQNYFKWKVLVVLLFGLAFLESATPAFASQTGFWFEDELRTISGAGTVTFSERTGAYRIIGVKKVSDVRAAVILEGKVFTCKPHARNFPFFWIREASCSSEETGNLAIFLLRENLAEPKCPAARKFGFCE